VQPFYYYSNRGVSYYRSLVMHKATHYPSMRKPIWKGRKGHTGKNEWTRSTDTTSLTGISPRKKSTNAQETAATIHDSPGVSTYNCIMDIKGEIIRLIRMTHPRQSVPSIHPVTHLFNHSVSDFTTANCTRNTHIKA